MGVINYSDTSVSPGTTYYYRIRAHNNMGYSGYSNVIGCTTLLNTSIFTADQDIGSLSPAGSYSEKSGTYTVNGSGSDIWSNSDQFQYVYKSLSGDGSITARVVNVEDTNGWAKAGVMFRNTLDAGSMNALMVLTPDNGASFQYRSSTNGSSSNSNSIGYAVPYWVRITRSGNNFSGYISFDGVNWTQVGSTVTLAMNTTVYVGLAVTSHSSGTMCTSIFSNVSVTPLTVSINQAASQADPASASPINFSVVFSEPVADFATGDVTLSGTAGATTAVVTGSGTTYNVAVSGMTSDGAVIASIAAGVAHDTAGNASTASTSTDNVVTLSTPTHTWGGGSTVNNLWTTKENWVGNVAPLPGDNLIFPEGAAQLHKLQRLSVRNCFRFGHRFRQRLSVPRQCLPIIDGRSASEYQC